MTDGWNGRWVAVEDLHEGDLVDLVCDPIVDQFCDSELFAEKYMEVAMVERETEDSVVLVGYEGKGCVVVGFEGFDHVGFPSGHKVLVKR